jgi:hypothetical protein
MASYAELESEPWWDREIPTSPMNGLGLQLRAAYGTDALSFGIKGNNKHLSGGHRSQEWILNSQYVDPPGSTYTVQTGLTSTQLRHLSAFDFTPGVWGTTDNRNKMKVLTKRVIDAMKAGQIDELDECFGTLDGVNVTGWNNDRNATITADSSHLDHIHCRFDRRFCDSNAVMSRLAAIMLGENEMTPGQEYKLHVINYRVDAIVHARSAVVVPAFTATDGTTYAGFTEQCQMGIMLATIQQGTSVDIPALVNQAITEAANDPTVEFTPTPEEIDALAQQVAAGVTATIDVPTAQENATATVEEFQKELAD